MTDIVAGLFRPRSGRNSSTEAPGNLQETEPADLQQIPHLAKFPDLNRFMKAAGDAQVPILSRPDYRPASELHLQPGEIFHVYDKIEGETRDERRLHAKIMIVIAACPVRYTCLAMCRHEPRNKGADHWPVHKIGVVNLGHSERVLNVKLRMYSPTVMSFEPAEKVTVNIADPWNIGPQQLAVRLGYVQRDKMRDLVDGHLEMYEAAVRHYSDTQLSRQRTTSPGRSGRREKRRSQ